jgi:hypothetical protein
MPYEIDENTIIVTIDQVLPQIDSMETAETIKTKYESNPNTNAFTDDEKDAIAINSNKVGITTEQAENILANNAKISYNDAAAVAANTLKRSYPLADEQKLGGIEDGATADQTGVEIEALYEARPNTNKYTDAERDKLSGLDDNHFKGKHLSLAALQIAHPTASEGDYAYVDAGVGEDSQHYIWDSSDSSWVLSGSVVTAETPASIKSKYESNANTNSFTDAEKLAVATNSAKRSYPLVDEQKLDAIESNAKDDQTDTEIETAYNNRVPIVFTSEAEGGTSTAVRRWTPQLIFTGWINWVQNKAISALNTTSKTLTGAINELKLAIENFNGGAAVPVDYVSVAGLFTDQNAQVADSLYRINDGERDFRVQYLGTVLGDYRDYAGWPVLTISVSGNNFSLKEATGRYSLVPKSITVSCDDVLTGSLTIDPEVDGVDILTTPISMIPGDQFAASTDFAVSTIDAWKFITDTIADIGANVAIQIEAIQVSDAIGILSTPVLTSVTPTEDQNTIIFTADGTATSHEIEVRTGIDSYAPVSPAYNGTSLTYVHTGLSPNTQYDYRIRSKIDDTSVSIWTYFSSTTEASVVNLYASYIGWPDANTDDIPDNTSKSSNASTVINVIANGFTEDSVRVTTTNGANTLFFTLDTDALVIGNTYNLKFERRNNTAAFKVRGAATMSISPERTFAINTGNAVEEDYNFTVNGGDAAFDIQFRFESGAASTNDWFEIANVRLYDITP